MTESSHSIVPAVATTTCEVAIVEFDGEPRARDVDLAERLGFERPRKTRELIERNMAEILSFGTCPTVGRVVRGVSAGQVLAMAGLGARKGLRGMAPWVSHRLRRFHAQKGAVVRMASLGSSQAYVFDPLIAREWLDDGGRAEIEQKAAEKRGQGKLRLVGGVQS